MPFKTKNLHRRNNLPVPSEPLGDILKKSKLWTIVTREPKSKRFIQLSFEGFRPKGRNWAERILLNILEFFSATGKYAQRKFKRTVKGAKKAVIWVVEFGFSMKALLVRKLIWSRGRLGRTIGTTIVMVAALLVFMFGKVLDSSKYVVSKEIDPDFLSNTNDIIPQRNIALTTIPEDRKRSEAFSYFVESGDTLGSIGSRYRISTDALKYVNSLTSDSLQVGQELIIPPVSGLIHKVEEGDTLTSLAEKYEVAPQAIADFNYILDTSRLALGTELVIPGASIPAPAIVLPPVIPGAPVQPGQPGVPDFAATKGWCIWPTTSRLISQNFAWYHNGLDITTPSGGGMPPIFSCAGGTVVRSGWDPYGLGLHVVIDHGNGYETTYGHMSRVDVGFGEGVDKGQTIGIMGSTGRSTGPHVHFIVKYNGSPQDPLGYIQ